jgi:predicted XRE-type DNA-binding protein
MSNHDQTIIRGTGNVFADLGVRDAAEHQLKASVVMLIQQVMKQHGISQVVAAERMGISQPDLSKLLRGSFRGFSLDRLLNCAVAIGVDFDIKAKPPADASHQGRLRLRVAA